MANKWVCLSQKERDTITQSITDQALIKKIKKLDGRIKVSSAKGKGRGLQQFVAERVSVITGIPYNNGDDNCLIHSREMGLSGVDVVLRGEALQKFPFSIECKSGENISLRSFVEQAKSNVKEGTDWLLVIRTKSIPETLIVISWDTFEKIFSKGEKK